jgi:hypothetical protein
VSIELKLVEQVIGRRRVVRRFEFGIVVVVRHGPRSFAGSAAPIAAFVAITRRQAERTRTRSNAQGRSEAEDGGGAAILLRDAKRAVVTYIM